MNAAGLFDFFSGHRKIRRGSLIVLSCLLAGLVATLHFSEDISDFLPLGTREREEMSLYQRISGADRLYLLFSNPGDADYTLDAVASFQDALAELKEAAPAEAFDWDALSGVTRFVYEHAPYFLTEADIARMDSLLATPGRLEATLANDRQMLLLPSASLASGAIACDPLGLFSPVMARLRSGGGQSGFELYGGQIFTPDMSRAVVVMDSPYGSSETEHNARLLSSLEKAGDQMQADYPDVAVDIIGGPAIAVGNADRIKKDSLLAISLSIILIVLLLVSSFKSFRNILLIFVSVGWGLLFALGGLALFRDSVSIIVIGICSVILGIAINYPLHLISHTAHQPDRKAALQEILSPLVVGNITTVGAFLALVPLKSTALRDLGLFASLLLVGTILFVIVYLPHAVSDHKDLSHKTPLLDRLAAFSPENDKRIVCCVLVLTLLLSVFSFRTGFDSDMSHINYMTERQKRDMQYFEDLLTNDTTHKAQTLYIYGKGATRDEALAHVYGNTGRIDSLAACGKLVRQNEASVFFVPEPEQQRRLDRWKAFVERHRETLTVALPDAAGQAGFAPGAFRPFYALLEKTPAFEPLSCDAFDALTRTVFVSNFAHLEENDAAYVVYPVNVAPEDMADVKAAFGDACFDVAGMNATMTGSLSDNFNYIGWACSLIVFLFLWFSFGRLELAIISFLPMAVSWLWILGLMALLGVKFNIVNIILATFIFGQGDDYTIFMTEGCQYEYARRSPILTSYKRSILQSAAIMFVGIGTLIVARHPAMRSLAEVTIIGMFSVVLMAYLIPPLLFKWMTTKGGRVREEPLSLRSLFCGTAENLPDKVENRYLYKGKAIERQVSRSIREHSAGILRQDTAGMTTLDFTDDGYGELALLLALSHPGVTVIAHLSDAERRAIAAAAADGIADNIEFKS